MLFEVVLKLQDVDVHDQRLAAAGGDPDRQLVQVGFVEGLDFFPLGELEVFIEFGAEGVEVGAERGSVGKVAVQVVFGEQQDQVLEIKRVEGVAAAVAAFGDAPPMADNVVVIAPERVIAHRPLLERLVEQFVEKQGVIFFIETDQVRVG